MEVSRISGIQEKNYVFNYTADDNSDNFEPLWKILE